jgi:polyribonucleotide nucleotidyltransferase
MKKQDFIKEIGGKTLKLQVSGLAEQADAAILATYGNTVVLATVVMGKKDVSMDYFPLKVDYEERFYAAGKILGSRFVRRETRPSEEAILSGRLIDRTIRPLFNQQMRREVQVVTTVLAIDEVNDPDFVSLIAASTALAISDIPWNGPVAGMRIARIAGQLVLNPSNVQTAAPDCEFDAFVSGPKGKINMIELGGYEAKEQDVVEGFEKAQKEIDALVDFQNEIVAKIGIKKQSVELHQIDPELAVMVGEFLKDKLEDAIYQPNKMEQQEKIAELKKITI